MRFLIPTMAMLLLSGCINYQQIQYQRADLFRNSRVEKHIEDYTVYVHKDDETVELKNPKLVENELKGEVTKVSGYDLVERPENKQELKEHRMDMHVYLEEDAEIDLSDIDLRGKELSIKETEVHSVSAVSTNEKEMISAIMLAIGISILVVTVIVLLVALLVAATVAAAAKGSESSSDGSNGSSDSGGSDAGSGASSDGSDASSDGSDASSDGSGSCYIATMAYGSYDAPEVIHLRKFRDSFLKKRKWGRNFIAWYYRKSPGWVDQFQSVKWLHRFIRLALNGLIGLLKWSKVI